MSDHRTLPTGWGHAKLGDVAKLINGDRGKNYPSKSEFVSEGVPFINAGHLNGGSIDENDLNFISEERFNLLGSGKIEPNDILYCLRGSLGKAAVVRNIEQGAIASSLVIIRAQAIVSPTYLYYFLVSPLGIAEIQKYDNGSAQPNLSAANVKSYRLPLAPLPEQHRIVSKIEELFSDLDAGVSALERAKANLKRYRASVLKAAVEGRLTADWRAANPDVEPATELLHRILTTRRQTWEANQLAEYERQGKKPPAGWQEKYKEPNTVDAAKLPKLSGGWTWACVDQVGKVQLGRQRAPKHHNGPNMRPYLRVANVFENRIDISDVMEMNFTPDEYDTYKLEYGDILLNEGQSFELIGRPAMYRDEVPGACFTNTLVRFRAAGELDRDFAFRVFLAYLKNGRFQKIASITVNIAHLGAGRFAELEFPLPPLEEQRKIVEVIDHHFSLIDASTRIMNASLRRAKRLRQSILKRAFEGKLLTNYSITKTEAIAK